MSQKLEGILLDEKAPYITTYKPSLLFPIERKQKREEIDIVDHLPFSGIDFWTGYELSWLNTKGKPVIALAEFEIPCESKFIVESKSFKLYLNSFNQTKFESFDVVKQTLERDLSEALSSPLKVNLYSFAEYQNLPMKMIYDKCIDELDVEVDTYHVNPKLLKTSLEQVEERLCSHLLKSNCLVTKQPDWGSVIIHYEGNKIDHASLLRYLISFREHYEFNEQCSERIFMHINEMCRPRKLTVHTKYTRRGGLGIESFRSNFDTFTDNYRTHRH